MARMISRAASAMLRAAEGGDSLSQVNLAVMHDSRRHADAQHGLLRDEAAAALHEEQSLKWWLRAANQGSAKAQAALALRYERGDGVAQDLVEALMWYLLAEPHLRGDDADRAVLTRRHLSRRMDPSDVRRAERRAGLWRPHLEAALAASA